MWLHALLTFPLCYLKEQARLVLKLLKESDRLHGWLRIAQWIEKHFCLLLMYLCH